jgi:hypothetical protein
VTEDDWRNVVICMQERALDRIPDDETSKEYKDCIDTLAAAYSLMDFYRYFRQF